MRFSGFDDEWNEVKLGDISTFLDNKRIPLKEDDRKQIKGEYPYYGASGIIDYVNDYIFDEELILMGEDGANIVTRSSKLIFLAKGKYWVNNHAHVIKADNNINQYFLSESLERINYEKYNTGTAQPKLNREVCQKIKVKIPQFNEQNKIANFLLVINEKLRLLEQKYQYYQNFKKYLMQQIFAQKLRFDFKDTWDKVLLKDVAFIPKKTKLTNIEGLKLLTVKLHTKGIEINDRIKPKLTKRGRPYYIRRSGELLIGRQNFHNGGMGIVPKSLDGGICSNAISSFNVFEDKIDVNYLYYFLARPEYYIKSERLIGGTGQKEFSEKELLKLKIDLPSLEEQNKIVDFLSNIDHKIELSENQLNKTQEFKKGLLQQMFIVQLILSLLQNKKHI